MKYPLPSRPLRSAFTLIEVMVVCAIMGMIVVAGIPAFAKMLKREGMRKVTYEVEQVCYQARKMAIFTGRPVAVVFRPREHQVSVESAAISNPDGSTPAPSSDSPQATLIPDDYAIEMLDINLWEYNDSEWARVMFYPNGTSDEMTLVLRSSKNEWAKISTEVTTGLTSVDSVR